MKRFYVKDEDGRDYTVEEMIEEKSTEDEEVVELTQEDISSLKKIIPHIDKIIEFVSKTTTEDEDEDIDEDVDEEEEITDEDFEEEKTEEIVDTDEDEDDEDDKKKTCDSKLSAASIKQKSTKTNDAFDQQIDVASAWAKRYEGGND